MHPILPFLFEVLDVYIVYPSFMPWKIMIAAVDNNATERKWTQTILNKKWIISVTFLIIIFDNVPFTLTIFQTVFPTLWK